MNLDKIPPEVRYSLFSREAFRNVPADWGPDWTAEELAAWQAEQKRHRRWQGFVGVLAIVGALTIFIGVFWALDLPLGDKTVGDWLMTVLVFGLIVGLPAVALVYGLVREFFPPRPAAPEPCRNGRCQSPRLCHRFGDCRG
jgi:hypothetical protein